MDFVVPRNGTPQNYACLAFDVKDILEQHYAI